MSDFLRQAMGEYEKILEEIRKKHLALASSEEQGRVNKAMSEMKTIHFQTLGLLNEEKRKSSELRNIVSTWTTICESMVNDLKKKDQDMEEKYNSVWLNRDQFCTSIEKTIRQLENLWKRRKNLFDAELKGLMEDVMVHLRRLEKLLQKKDDTLDEIDNEMIERENYEKKDSLNDEELQEMTRLTERIPRMCAEYQEVENEIARTKKIISRKTNYLLKQAKKKNNLYSIVNLNDVKKLESFKTAPKQPNP